MSIYGNIIYINNKAIALTRYVILLLLSAFALLPLSAQVRTDIKTSSGDNESGEALVIYRNGDRYDGYFQDSLFHGEGLLKKKDKTFYEGGFQKGKYHGYGYLQLPNKDIYEGDFKEGLYDGKGILYEYKGRTYSGDFVKGKMEGQGTITLINGDKYIGSFKDNEIDGYGEYYSKGFLTTGMFKLGKLIDGRIINLETQEAVHISGGKPAKEPTNPNAVKGIPVRPGK